MNKRIMLHVLITNFISSEGMNIDSLIERILELFEVGECHHQWGEIETHYKYGTFSDKPDYTYQRCEKCGVVKVINEYK